MNRPLSQLYLLSGQPLPCRNIGYVIGAPKAVNNANAINTRPVLRNCVNPAGNSYSNRLFVEPLNTRRLLPPAVVGVVPQRKVISPIGFALVTNKCEVILSIASGKQSDFTGTAMNTHNIAFVICNNGNIT